MTKPAARPLAMAMAAAASLSAGAVLFCAGTAWADGDPARGRQIAEKQCSRCHVIGQHNPFGGIGSTASFQMIVKMADGIERFQTFYARRPHPAFLHVPGVARWSTQPGARYAKEFTVTLDEVDDIVAFVQTLKTLPIKRRRN